MDSQIDEEFPPTRRSDAEEQLGEDQLNSDCDDTSNSVQPQTEMVNIQIGPQHFDLLKLIGEGAFGKVLLVRNRLDKSLYAMKVLSKKLLKKKNNTQYMKSERDILTKVSHPFVVSLYFAFQSQSKLFLVMEFLQGGELFFHLRKKGIILEKEARFYLGELTLAIEFLHNNGVVHRDLKPENVLLRKDGHISITDFGLGKPSRHDLQYSDHCLVLTCVLCAVWLVLYSEGDRRLGDGAHPLWNFRIHGKRNWGHLLTCLCTGALPEQRAPQRARKWSLSAP